MDNCSFLLHSKVSQLNFYLHGEKSLDVAQSKQVVSLYDIPLDSWPVLFYLILLLVVLSPLRACSFGPGSAGIAARSTWNIPVWIDSRPTLEELFG